MLRNAQACSKMHKRELSFDDGKRFWLSSRIYMELSWRDRADQNWTCIDPLTFTKTDARLRFLLESMLCVTAEHGWGLCLPGVEEFLQKQDLQMRWARMSFSYSRI